MSFRRAAYLGATMALAGGCATVTTTDGQRLRLTSAEFRNYVESVFREQNRVADELAFEQESPAADTLDAAEAVLLTACAGVNELATARRDERRLGLGRRLEAARGVPACEEATRAAQEALAAEGGR